MDRKHLADGALILATNAVYKGKLFGSDKLDKPIDCNGEVVFQTGMVGYCESLTDPSYNGQILTLTYPLIGNYGVPGEFNPTEMIQNFESNKIWPKAVVIADLSTSYSHWSAMFSLDDWLTKNNIVGLQEIDTRKLVRELRSRGTIPGRIVRLSPELDVLAVAEDLRQTITQSLITKNLVEEVTYFGEWVLNPTGSPKILLLNCGTKQSIATRLTSGNRNARVEIVPYTYDLVSNQDKFDGLVLSNGPGNPQDCQVTIDNLTKLFSDPNYKKPTFGICLGHQLMGISAGHSTYKMKFGNRGHNQPCRFMNTKRSLITSQNHGYAIKNKPFKSNTNDDWFELFVNQNDHSNEGICHKTKPFFSVQFHPEHSAGPDDSEFLFDIFLSLVRDKTNDVENRIKKHLETNQSDAPQGIKKVLILGSGGLSIGQAGEFDYSGSQAIKALKDEGIFTILINPNIATVQTSPTLVDRVYLLPVTLHYVTEVIKKERPDGMMLMFGGQTALNCGIALEKAGLFETYKIQVLGPPITAIKDAEDRERFSIKMEEIDVKVAPSYAIKSKEDVGLAVKKLGYPILVRAAFALGGLGSGFANNRAELDELVHKALAHSEQILFDKSLKGWKEVEYEVVRDIYDNCAAICNMENVDPLGIHTGESIVVAPSQTLNDYEYNKLRSVAIRIVRHLKIVGECNVQYAVNPYKDEFYVIEINPRLSRSSALASKATGYPLAYIAAKLALGKSLTDLNNSVTSSDTVKTTACFEPSLDYCVVKIPRWDLSKFDGVTREIGSSMKSIGEVMAIGRKFEEAFQKALRMVNDSITGFDAKHVGNDEEIARNLKTPTDKRIFILASALENGWSLDKLHQLTSIDKWFLHKMSNIVSMKAELKNFKSPKLSFDTPEFGNILLRAKKLGFSDKQIGNLIEGTELIVRKARCDYHKLWPYVKQVDTVAAEWPASTNYLYLTYNADEHDIYVPNGKGDFERTLTKTAPSSPSKRRLVKTAESNVLHCETSNGNFINSNGIEDVEQKNSELIIDANNIDSGITRCKEKKQQVMVLGSGVYRIGSSVEFDCCAVGCVRELRKMSNNVIMINYNPETVSTDYDECDKLYFEEISFEVVMDIYNLEKPEGILLSMGGQLPNNIAMDLHRQKARILGTSPENIDNAENRFKFSRLLDTCGIEQPVWRELTELKEAFSFCSQVKYPCIVRPSYVLSGAAMNVVKYERDLVKFLSQATAVSKEHPVVISKFIENAKEIDIDAVAKEGQVICMAVSEHVENAGVHSGDATLVTPPQDLNPETLEQIKDICLKIANALVVNGPFNMQLIAKDNQLKVIECNLRASRSFPFVSKTLGYDFIAAATRVIMGEDVTPVDVIFGQANISSNYTPAASQRTRRVGVKVAQFSFSRLSGADIKLGVEMASTGEVACFGNNRYSAYLKALISTGFKLPEQKKVLLSIEQYRHKEEFLESFEILTKLGYILYAERETYDYYDAKLRDVFLKQGTDFDLLLHQVDNSKMTPNDNIGTTEYLSDQKFGIIINLPDACRNMSSGFETRRFAVDHGVPLISDIKCAKLLVKALNYYDSKHPSVSEVDCLTSSNIVTLPGLIDVHVHVREPGATHKEDFESATKAALAGGVTFIGVMPNTDPPIVDAETLKLEKQLASKKSLCDYGLIVGASPSNAQSIAMLATMEPVLALKMYLNNTYGTLCMSNISDWEHHFALWPSHLPICVHAEGDTASTAIVFAQHYNKKLHICHVSTEREILIIKRAKALQSTTQITCEVAPHHLFLTADDTILASDKTDKLKTVKPPLVSARDQQALWDNMDVIDCFATDHAPHLLSEKLGDKPPPGFPGIETMVPMLINATHSKDPSRQLTILQIVEKLYTNPKRIFNIPDQLDTSIEIDMNAVWTINNERLFSKSQWTPFAGRQIRGKVIKVTLRNEVVFVDDKFLVQPGFGRDLIVDRTNLISQPQIQTQIDASKQLNVQPIQMSQVMNIHEKPPTPTLLITASELHTSAAHSASGAFRYRSDSCVSQSAANLISSSFADLKMLGAAYKVLRNKHLIEVDIFDRDVLHELFNLAERFLKDHRNKRPIEQILHGKVMSTVFYENSTRTEYSFASAMCLLGGKVLHWNQANSSVLKGETLEDTVRTMSGYTDVVVLRHPEPGAVTRGSLVSTKPVVNGGDGTGEHPTQALLDVFTIRKEIGTVSKLVISFVGDLKNGRTVHSLAKLLGKNYDTRELRFVAPAGLEMPESILKYLSARQVNYKTYSSLEEIISDSDVVYMTRIQKERFNNEDFYKQCCGQFHITPQLMKKAKEKKMIVMHPLPRNDEISPDFDNDPRAAYFRQAEYGLYVRMALLALVLT